MAGKINTIFHNNLSEISAIDLLLANEFQEAWANWARGWPSCSGRTLGARTSSSPTSSSPPTRSSPTVSGKRVPLLAVCAYGVWRPYNWTPTQGGPSAETVGLDLLRFGMFRHLAWAVGSYSSGPPAGGTPQIQDNLTQLSQQMDSHT